VRVVGFWSAVGAVIGGIILADLVTHAAGTKSIIDAGVSGEKVSVNGLLGKTS